jgi:DNA uptake protein ComE-like DNA-binding protein
MSGTRSRQAGTGTGTGSTGTAAQIDTTNSTIPLCELVTTYSREANNAADGTKRINVKTANRQDLTKMLTDAGVAQADMRFLNTFIGTPATNGRPATGQQANVTKISDLMGTVPPAPVVTAWPKTTLALVADKITVSDAPFLNGKININTAPPEVLATIPGMDQTLYNLLTQFRQQGKTFSTLNDLFQPNVFTQNAQGQAQLQTLMTSICTKSSVYIVRVKVRMPGTSRIYAAQALVELAAPPPPTTTTTGGSTTGGSSSTAAQTDTSQPPPTPKILQWREIGRTPGWTSWAPAHNYYTNNSTGGTVGNP